MAVDAMVVMNRIVTSSPVTELRRAKNGTLLSANNIAFWALSVLGLARSNKRTVMKQRKMLLRRKIFLEGM